MFDGTDHKRNTDRKTDQYKRLINDMIEDRLFNDQSEFLKSIREFIKINNHITEKQIKAVNKIYMNKAERE
jgi:Arc/MetJ-type ribon-helix-helix transcriptional regulator